jgi:hypothetical protein
MINFPVTVVVPPEGIEGNSTSTPLLSWGKAHTGWVTCWARLLSGVALHAAGHE